MKKKKVVVIGGGTGTFSVLTGLKHYKDISLQAIVTVTDSGGSTGRLRDEYGILPVGDIRQCLVALANGGNGDNLLRKLFLYRFDRGDMDGHNFGNLFLTAMTDILGSEKKAISYVSRVLKIRGEVIPITTKDIDLVAEYEDGSVLVGEADIDEPDDKHDNTTRIKKLRVQPNARISKDARDAILNSDYIILGPGDLYSSLLSNFVVQGATSALKKSRAAFIYVMNLMTKTGQTHGFTATDHVKEVEKYTGRTPDFIIIHDRKIPRSIIKRYEKEHAHPVINDLNEHYSKLIKKGDIASTKIIPKVSGDKVKRSIIRHNSKKLAAFIHDFMNT